LHTTKKCKTADFEEKTGKKLIPMGDDFDLSGGIEQKAAALKKKAGEKQK
jgi:hypothetical protein